MVTYSQTGVGYLNYTIYNLYSYTGSGGRNAYANSATDFDNMFNTANGTTVYKSGTGTAAATLNYNNTFLTGVPNGAGYFGIKTYGYFVPKETGTYSFGVDGDDGVDVVINGNVVTSFYGPHGFGGLHYGTVNLIAGQSYTFVARFQQVGGGWGLQVMWKRPSQTTWSVQADEVTSIAPAIPTKKAIVNFNFNSAIDATKFSIGSTALNTAGSVDITTSLDSVKINTGYKANIVGGGVEWSYVNLFNGVSTLYVDMRKFGNVVPNTVNSVSVLDVYTGPVTFTTSDGTWAQYTIPNALTSLPTSTNQYVRNAGYGNYAFACDITFAVTQAYKPQSITLTTTNTLSTLYSNILTVTDVYLAFKEFANRGILGNQSGNEFTYGIQYKNADINNDGVLDESDCFILLQHLTGKKNIVDTFKLSNTLKLIPTLTYNTIGKSTWTTFPSYLGSSYSFDINTGKSIDTLNIAVGWKGDVNLSHSTTPPSNNITTNSLRSMAVSNEIQSSIITELINDTVYVTIKVNPLTQELVGTQFKLNYDNSLLKFNKVIFNTKGTPTNFGTDKGDYINFGSLITDGSTLLDNTTEYKIILTPTSKLDNILGLISVYFTDAVNKAGNQLKIKML
jgi:hypothetical protein